MPLASVFLLLSWVAQGVLPSQPEETLGGDVLLGGQLVLDKLLEVGGLAGSGELTVTNLLYVGNR